MNRIGNAKSWRERYRQWMLIAFNTLVLLLFINAGLWALFEIRDSRKSSGDNQIRAADRRWRRYGTNNILSVYPNLSHAEVDRLLQETWSRRSHMPYEPFVQYREAPSSGKYVNVSSHGFRKSWSQSPWPPSPENLNVFFFGGSTTFGYGVPDEQTIASFLAREVESEKAVAVYNFGRAGYQSRQEAYLFQQLVSDGHDIDFAIFIDGLNEFTFSILQFTKRLQKFMENKTAQPPSRFPMKRLADAIRRRLSPAPEAPAVEPSLPPDTETILSRYEGSGRLIRAVAEAYGVKPIFVWQPTPGYGIDLDSYPFAPDGLGRAERCREGYKIMAARLDRESAGKHILWCADLHDTVKPPMYVDRVHYTPNMNRAIAQRIVAAIRKQRE